MKNLLTVPRSVFDGIDVVYHLAADSDVRSTYSNIFNDDVLATFSVLENIHRAGVREIVFTSSSTVYGDATQLPTPEDYPPNPISFYGMSKLIGEQLLQAYSWKGMMVTILRIGNVIGPRCHGIIPELIAKLRSNDASLEVLGDGTQEKGYIHIDDFIKGMLRARQNGHRFCIYNISSSDTIRVMDIVGIICERMRVAPVIRHKSYEDGRGWAGDVKEMHLDSSYLTKTTGWRPICNSRDAVEKTVDSFLKVEA